MEENHLEYYNNELAYLRRAGMVFAKKYPKIAANLQLGLEEVEDPHVSRLIEAFAFLTARINQRLDAEFPEICDALFNIMYPHYLMPVPAMTIIKIDPTNDLTQSYHIPKFTALDTKSEFGEVCHFRTCYELNLLPIKILAAYYKTRPFAVPSNLPKSVTYQAMLKMDIGPLTKEVNIAVMAEKKIRIYLNLPKSDVYNLYQLLFNNLVCVSITKENSDVPIKIFSNSIITAVGFSQTESLLEYKAQAFTGYRLLTEFFYFPDKFLFFELDLTKEQMTLSKIEQNLTINFYFNKAFANLETQIAADCFLLGCTPIVNLFSYKAEPIIFDQQHSQYRIIPDLRQDRNMQIYAIRKVVALEQTGVETEILPFYGLNHHVEPDGDAQFYWYASTENAKCGSGAKQETTIAFTAASMRQLMQDTVISIDLLCTNHELPAKLTGTSNNMVLEFRNAIAKVKTIKQLLPFTVPKQFTNSEDKKWRLISQLSLNYLSLTNTPSGLAALKEILTLYNITKDRSTRDLISGISRLTSRQVTSRLGNTLGNVLCQGIEIAIEFDPKQYTGMGIYLFSAVLEQFFSQYCNINAFTQLVVYLKDQEEELCRWKPRAGMQALL